MWPSLTLGGDEPAASAALCAYKLTHQRLGCHRVRVLLIDELRSRAPQRDVDQDDLRLELLDLPKRLVARRRHARDGQALSLEQHACGLEEGVIVVDDQNADRHQSSFATTAPARIAANG
jgi:hypothetical protein